MEQPKVYACYNTNKDVRRSSSSGAIFSSLAEYVFGQQGVVYGVAMSNDCYSAEFVAAANKDELTKLRGSKYLQAKVGDTYKLVKADLMSEKLVLFTGTGCQVNGLKGFLGKDYDNLICVDIICHGVPSPALWREYAKHREQKNEGKLKGVNFRCKDNNWTDFGMREIIKRIPEGECKTICISKDVDLYMQMFLKNYCLRPSCYECVAKNVKTSDLTIADFWGINNIAPEMNDGMGTSLVLVRTGKGEQIFKGIRDEIQLKVVSYEEGVKSNPAEFKSCARPVQRDTFFDDIHSMKFEDLEKKYAAHVNMTFKGKMKRRIKNIMKNIRAENINKKKNMDYSLCFVFDCQEKNQ